MTSFLSLPIKEINILHLYTLEKQLNLENHELLSKSCTARINHLNQVLQRPLINKTFFDLACQCLENLLTFAAKDSQLSRDLSNQDLSHIVDIILTSSFLPTTTAFHLFILIVDKFPAPARNFISKLEKKIFSLIDVCLDSHVVKIVAQCHVKMAFVGQNTKKDQRWNDFQEKIHGSFIETLLEFFILSEITSELEDSKVIKKFSFSSCKIDGVANVLILKRRLNFLIYELQSIFLLGAPFPVSLHFSSFVQSIVIFLSVNTIKLASHKSTKVSELPTILLELQTCCWNLITVFFKTLRQNMALVSSTIFSLIMQHLDWTKSKFELWYTNNRVAVYKCLQALIEECGVLSLMSIYSHRFQLMDHLLNDIQIDLFHESALFQTTIAVSNPGKKSKKKRSINKKKLFDASSNSNSYLTSSSDFSNLDSNVVASSWMTLTSFWFELSDFIDRHPMGLETVTNNTTSILEYMQYNVERILKKLNSLNSLVPPYNDYSVISSFMKFLDIFYLPKQRAVHPISISLIVCFFRNQLNNSNPIVSLAARKYLSRINASVSAWTPRLGKMEASLVHHQCEDIAPEHNSAIDIEILKSTPVHTVISPTENGENECASKVTVIYQCNSTQTNSNAMNDSELVRFQPEMDVSVDIPNKKPRIDLSGDIELVSAEEVEIQTFDEPVPTLPVTISQQTSNQNMLPTANKDYIPVDDMLATFVNIV